MKALFRLLRTVTLTLLGGCSALIPAPVTPGESETEVIASRGQPTHRYQDGLGVHLGWNTRWGLGDRKPTWGASIRMAKSFRLSKF